MGEYWIYDFDVIKDVWAHLGTESVVRLGKTLVAEKTEEAFAENTRGYYRTRKFVQTRIENASKGFLEDPETVY